MKLNNKLLERKSLFEEPLKPSGFSPLDSVEFKWQSLSEKLLLVEKKQKASVLEKLLEQKKSGDYLFNLGKNSTYVEEDEF